MSLHVEDTDTKGDSSGIIEGDKCEIIEMQSEHGNTSSH